MNKPLAQREVKHKKLILYAAAAAVVAALVFIKLSLCSNQLLELYPGAAPIDDELMFAAARQVYAGNWLGEYNQMTIAKHMFFSVWLAFVMKLGIPYVIACQSLYCAACAAAALAVLPFFKKKWPALVVFAALWLSPYSWANFTLRVYRDSIFPSLCLLFFAGIIGMCARFREKPVTALPFAALGGLGLGAAWLTREDGVWLLPFGVCAALAYIILALLRGASARERLLRLASPALAAAVCMLCIGLYCNENQKHYGRFIVSDFTSSEFEDAVGALIRADADRPHKRNVLVCYDARQKIAAASPMWAEIEGVLASNSGYYKGYGYAPESNLKSGGFCWALRDIVQNLGHADTALEAEDYYTRLAAEVNAACDSGAIKTPYKKMSTTLMPWNGKYLIPTLEESGRTLRCMLAFEQTSSIANACPDTEDAVIDYIRLLRTKAATERDLDTAEPIVQPFQLDAEAKFSAIRWVYKILIWPCLALALYSLVLDIKGAARELKEKRAGAITARAVMQLGLLLSVLLRVAIVSYVETASFMIGTYLLYFASAGPLLLLFCAVGTLSAFTRGRRETKQTVN